MLLFVADLQGSVAQARACYFDVANKWGAFASVPLTAGHSVSPVFGVRYSSPLVTAGGMIRPTNSQLHCLWLVRTYKRPSQLNRSPAYCPAVGVKYPSFADEISSNELGVSGKEDSSCRNHCPSMMLLISMHETEGLPIANVLQRLWESIAYHSQNLQIQ